MKPQRVQLKRTKDWRMPPNTVKVDRTTKWGNPFIVGKNGDAPHCIQLYRSLLRGYINLSQGDACCLRQDKTMAVLKAEKDSGWPTLRGRNLACWCRLDQPCHADVLLEIANK